MNTDLAWQVRQFLLHDFHPHYYQLHDKFDSKYQWRKLQMLGTDLWLDTGDISQAADQWTREFSSLTTNNTLLNNEVQKGIYNTFIAEASDMLDTYAKLSTSEKLLELSFMLNVHHALKLIEIFDAHVSVELHTDLANDIDKTVYYAKRYSYICPERFIIKVPLTPAGLIAARILGKKGIRINQTLGFSARQNYIAAKVAAPAYVNVFLGRLNTFIQTNKLGTGKYVGQKATLASQAIITNLREKFGTRTKQIGASFRSPDQITDLAGIDVMTVAPPVADEFLKLDLDPEQFDDRTEFQYTPGIKESTDPEEIRLDTLWNIDRELENCLDGLQFEDVDKFTPQDLIDYFVEHDCGDIFIPWSDQELARSRAEGKIPKLHRWKDQLADRAIGLDSLMNLAGLNSFASDQAAMDQKIRQVLAPNI